MREFYDAAAWFSIAPSRRMHRLINNNRRRLRLDAAAAENMSQAIKF